MVNKSFILNNFSFFFISCGLDFLFVTETLFTSGDLSLFSELVPFDCKYFSSPRTSGQGGGLASIFKQNLCCWTLTTDDYYSYELQLLVLEIDHSDISPT